MNSTFFDNEEDEVESLEDSENATNIDEDKADRDLSTMLLPSLQNESLFPKQIMAGNLSSQTELVKKPRNMQKNMRQSEKNSYIHG